MKQEMFLSKVIYIEYKIAYIVDMIVDLKSFISFRSFWNNNWSVFAHFGGSRPQYSKILAI